jgi:putative SOS response-associated peptidase YedK
MTAAGRGRSGPRLVKARRARIRFRIMCGRFTLTERDLERLARKLGVPVDALVNYSARYNIAPMQNHFIVTAEYESRKASVARWGLVPRWAKDNKRASQCINAIAETVEVKPSFRDAFKQRRCVVPADGFYEWSGPRSARRPQWIHRRDGELMLFAGLYESWRPPEGESETTFTIITCAPNAVTAPIHNRMPVILSDRDADDWMNPREPDPLSLKRLLVPAPDDLLTVQPASPLANSVKNEGPELLEAAAK